MGLLRNTEGTGSFQETDSGSGVKATPEGAMQAAGTRVSSLITESPEAIITIALTHPPPFLHTALPNQTDG